MSNPTNDQFDFGDFDLPSEEAAPQEPQQPAVEQPQQQAAPEEKQPAAPKQPKEGLLAQLKKTSPITVMLGLSLLAILVAIAFLAMELSRYGFDTSGSNYRQGVMTPVDQDTFPTISATA